MSWKNSLLDFCKRHGEMGKFAAKTVLGAVLPGSPVVVDLVGKALDCAVDAGKDHWDITNEPAMSDADAARLAEVLDMLQDNLVTLIPTLTALQSMPAVAQQVLAAQMVADETLAGLAVEIQQSAEQFDAFAEQQRQILENQRFAGDALIEMLAIMRPMAGMGDFFRELKASGIGAHEIAGAVATFRAGQEAMATGKLTTARESFATLAASHESMPVAQMALASAQAVGHDMQAAQQTIERATKLAPSNRRLTELHHRVTRLSKATPPAPGIITSPISTPTAKPPSIGDLVDGWRLDALLGHGGMGQVFRAINGERTAALKVMQPHLSHEAGFAARFRQEIAALLNLPRHPNLVRILDFNHVGNCWFYVMEFIAGESLESRLESRGSLTVADARPMFAAIADGLAAAHARNIIHRDIKPANIILRQGTNEPVLVDFGLAFVEAGANLTATGRAAGYTAMFAAPEQIRGGAVTAASDVWSLAATLLYAVNFAHADADARQAHSAETDDFPDDLREVLAKALANRPARRFANGAEFRDALRGQSNARVEESTSTTGTQTAAQPAQPKAVERPEPTRTIEEFMARLRAEYPDTAPIIAEWLAKAPELGFNFIAGTNTIQLTTTGLGGETFKLMGVSLTYGNVGWEKVYYEQALARAGLREMIADEFRDRIIAAVPAFKVTTGQKGSTFSANFADLRPADFRALWEPFDWFRQQVNAPPHREVSGHSVLGVPEPDHKSAKKLLANALVIGKRQGWELRNVTHRGSYCYCLKTPESLGRSHEQIKQEVRQAVEELGCEFKVLKELSSKGVYWLDFSAAPRPAMGRGNSTIPAKIREVSGYMFLGEQEFACPNDVEGEKRFTLPVYRCDAFVRALLKAGKLKQEPTEIFVPGQTRNAAVDCEFVLLPPPGHDGRFVMGDKNDSPKQTVAMRIAKPFLIARTTVTQRVYLAIGGEHGKFDWPGDMQPANEVSWNDIMGAEGFIARAGLDGLRLPSEAEWEFACRAGTQTPFCFGSGKTVTSKLVKFDGGEPYRGGPESESRKRTVEVASLPMNGFGLFEVHGNVWELCADAWLNKLKRIPSDGSARFVAGASYRVYRGPRSADRNRLMPMWRFDWIGFRPVQALSD